MHIKKFPKTFYKYIFDEITKPFIGAMIFFVFVLMMFQVVRLADFFVVHNVSAKVIVTLMSYMAMGFAPIVIPIAFLLALLLGLGRLSSDAEITAMRASGLSIYSMSVPAIFLGVVLCIVMIFCNLYFVPWANRTFRYELFKISNTKAIATIHDGTFTDGFFDLVIYADSIDSHENTMERVLIYDERKSSDPVTIVAKHGKIMGDVQDAEGMPGLLMRLYDGNLQKVDPLKNTVEMVEFGTYDIFLKIETGKFAGIEKPKTLDITDLKQKIVSLKEEYGGTSRDHPRSAQLFADINQHIVEYWKRYALAVSCIIFAFMGVAFGVVRTRTVRSNSFLICLGVLVFYWVIYSVGDNLATAGRIPAPIGVWSANLILFIVSVYALRKVAK